jgi:hypothetical protein
MVAENKKIATVFKNISFCKLVKVSIKADTCPVLKNKNQKVFAFFLNLNKRRQ